MPAFSRLQTKYAANGVQFVGIALDTTDNVRFFTTQTESSYPLLIGDAAGADLARILGNARLALPYTLIITPSGKRASLDWARFLNESLTHCSSKKQRAKVTTLDKVLRFAANLQP